MSRRQLVAAALLLVTVLTSCAGTTLAVCGDDYCGQPSETCRSCPQDCGPCQGPAEIVTRCVNPKAYTFTFDDGPSQATDQLLDTLSTFGVQASFFVVGDRIVRYSSTMRRAIAEGHFIAAHSWSHADLSRLPLSGVREEIRKVEAAVRAHSCMRPRVFRPPYGAITPSGLKVLNDMGYMVVNWNLDTLDWQVAAGSESPSAAYARVEDTMNTEWPGSIIHLQHDLQEDSIAMVPTIINMVREKGYSIVSLQECLYGAKAFPSLGPMNPSLAYQMQGCNSVASDAGQNCVLSAWTSWTGCDMPCGFGTSTRTRYVVTPAGPGGVACGVLEERALCDSSCNFCGDGMCNSVLESCHGCPRDCGPCQEPGIASTCKNPGEYALTFDDGPSPVTDGLLDILGAKGVKASFFVMGQQLENPNNVATLKRVHAEGHFIGSHTYSHPDLKDLSPSQVVRQLADAERAIYKAICVRPRLMRPPYASLPEAQQSVIESMGYKAVTWSMDVNDWAYARTTPSVMFDRLLNATSHYPAPVIHLQHDWYPESVAAVADMIDLVKAAGYKFVSIEQCVYGKESNLNPSIHFSRVRDGCARDEVAAAAGSCVVSDWSAWSPCNSTCSTGSKSRTRLLISGTAFKCGAHELSQIKRCVCCVQRLLPSTRKVQLSENGTRAVASMTVALNCEPLRPGDFVLSLQPSLLAGAVGVQASQYFDVRPRTVAFSRANYTAPVVLTLTSRPNTKNEGDRTFAIAGTALDGDGVTEVKLPEISVVVEDDDYDPNAPDFDSEPIASAGADQYLQVNPSQEVTLSLDGSGSRALDGDAIVCSWSILEVPALTTPAALSMASPGSCSTTVVGKLAPGRYEFRLAVSDPSGHVAVDRVQVWAMSIVSAPAPVGGASCLVGSSCMIAFSLQGVAVGAITRSTLVLYRQQAATTVGGTAPPAQPALVLAHATSSTVVQWAVPGDVDTAAEYHTRVTVTVTLPGNSAATITLSSEGAAFAIVAPFALEQGVWGACSSTCGPGVRRRALRCYAAESSSSGGGNGASNAAVPLAECVKALGASAVPATERLCFERACGSKPGWRVGVWSDCDAACGASVQRRSVDCVDRSGSAVDPALCSELDLNNPANVRPDNMPLDMPPTVQSCNQGPCDSFRWQFTAWRACTQQCGSSGMQYRTAMCVSSRGQVMTSTLPCGGSPPSSEALSRSCNRKACSVFYWQPAPWGACTKRCGGGMVTRGVSCIEGATGATAASQAPCEDSGGFMPSTQRACNQQPCDSYIAFVGAWGDTCSAPVSSASGGDEGAHDTCVASRNRTLSCRRASDHSEVEAAKCWSDEGDIVAAPQRMPLTTQRCWGLDGVGDGDGDDGDKQEGACGFCAHNTCMGRGECSEDEGCKCFEGYSGAHCERKAVCPSPHTAGGVAALGGSCCESEVLTPEGGCCGKDEVVASDGKCCAADKVDACGVCDGDAVVVDALGVCCATVTDASGLCCKSGVLDACGVCDGVGACAQNARLHVSPPSSLAGVDTSDLVHPAVLDYTGALVTHLSTNVQVSERLIRLGQLQRSRRQLAAQAPRVVTSLRGAPQQQRDLMATGMHIDVVLLPNGDSPNTAETALHAYSSWASSPVVHVAAVEVLQMQGVCGNGMCEIGERCDLRDAAAVCCSQDCPFPTGDNCFDGASELACNGKGICVTGLSGRGTCVCHSALGFVGDTCSQCGIGSALVNGACVANPGQGQAPPRSEVEEPSFLERFVADSPVQAAGIGGGVLLLGIVMCCCCAYFSRRSRQAWSKEQSMYNMGVPGSEKHRGMTQRHATDDPFAQQLHEFAMEDAHELSAAVNSAQNQSWQTAELETSTEHAARGGSRARSQGGASSGADSGFSSGGESSDGAASSRASSASGRSRRRRRSSSRDKRRRRRRSKSRRSKRRHSRRKGKSRRWSERVLDDDDAGSDAGSGSDATGSEGASGPESSSATPSPRSLAGVAVQGQGPDAPSMPGTPTPQAAAPPAPAVVTKKSKFLEMMKRRRLERRQEQEGRGAGPPPPQVARVAELAMEQQQVSLSKPASQASMVSVASTVSAGSVQPLLSRASTRSLFAPSRSFLDAPEVDSDSGGLRALNRHDSMLSAATSATADEEAALLPGAVTPLKGELM